VGFWAYSELTSVFLVYGMPAVPGAFVGIPTRVNSYYAHWTRRSSAGRVSHSSNARTAAPWQDGRHEPNNKYRNLDKASYPLQSIDTKFSRWGSTITSTNDDRDEPIQLPANGVLRTIEVQSEESHAGNPGGLGGDSGEDVLLRQHPWAQK
jgi:hypothetical protein